MSFRLPLPALSVAVVLVACLSESASLAWGGSPDFRGDRVVRVVPQDVRQMRVVLATTDDVWSHGIEVGKPVDVRVNAEQLAALRRAGLRPSVLIDDVGAAIASEQARIAAGGEGGVAGTDAWFADYKTLAQIDAKLDEFAAQRPDLVSTVFVGNSLEGRPIRGVRVSSAAPGAPSILFNGCQHAREWISPMTVMYIANRMVDNASTDPAVASILSHFEIFFVPVSNPDGYQYTWDVNRLWRKNRRNNGDGSFGVDLNRNWSFQWGGSGASALPSDETYRGPFAFSEPESQALRDFYLAHSTIIGSIDFHSYGQLVMSPWGYTTALAPDAALLQSIGNGMRDAIFATTGTPYVAGPIGPTLYLAAGNVVDWAYGARDVLSYTIELRDTGQTGFILPANQIIPTGQENYAAVTSFLTALEAPASVTLPNGAPTQVTAGQPTQFAVLIRELSGQLVSGGAKLYVRTNPNAAFQSSPLASAGTNLWTATLPATPCGQTLQYYVEAETDAGVARSPSSAPAQFYSAPSVNEVVSFVDTFETNLGWTVGGPQDNATSGQWVRVDPNGTIAQPESDSSPNGTLCYVTGQGSVGGQAGEADVDNGQTTLTSPVLDCSAPDSVIRYDRWYSNNAGSNPNSDSMPVEISSDGGLNWTQLELVTENANAWVTKSFLVADYVAPTANVRVRFIARDLGAGSLVEAGVDEFRVLRSDCPPVLGDLNGDGVVDASDLALLLGAWGANGGAADLDGNGVVDAGDLAILLGAWT
ncbi:MAG: M14 family zinc carboxypeptidase [Phycisphaerales bacterium]